LVQISPYRFVHVSLRGEVTVARWCPRSLRGGRAPLKVGSFSASLLLVQEFARFEQSPSETRSPIDSPTRASARRSPNR